MITLNFCCTLLREPETHLQHLNLTLGVKLKVTVSLEPSLDQLSELSWESRIVEVVHSKSGPGCLGRVCGSDTFLGSTD